MRTPPPRATYRLQLGPGLNFDAARSLVPYLRDLGISHLYLSPVTQARPQSQHGYDVIDPNLFSAALGGEAGFMELAQSARDAGLGVILDVVPNHMAADEANPRWAEREARERFFDIDPATGRHRRFFDHTALAAVRQEDPVVFEQTHRLVLQLVREGLIDGVRIDHPDGLTDPGAYLHKLRDQGVERAWVEKVLDPGERLREWPVCGTVGYEFLGDVGALFVDPHGEDALSALWASVSGDGRGFEEVALEAKLEQVRTTFRPELKRLHRLHPSLPETVIERGLASLPVYRTYVDPASGRIDEQDRQLILAADMDPALRRVLLLEDPAPPEFVTRFQQTTPAVMAKGIEDTAFYRYARLLALNEVGGDPRRFGISVKRFHAANLERAERFPENLLSTQTHDAKRSADVRARIGALASMPQEWQLHVERWLEITEPLRAGGAPDEIERYFLFQTLVGTWPIEPQRLQSYMTKALREAKRNSSWIEPNEEWEQAVGRFCHALYEHREFLRDFEPFVATVGVAGERSALGQLTLKLTAPGIPDIYQGDELEFRALVDPDNRRPLDWRWYEAMLSRLIGGSPPAGETRKLFLILRLLGLRARRPEPFMGSYEPLTAGERCCAFVRGGEVLVAVAVRGGVPEGVLEAPPGRWRDVLRGEERSFGGRTPLADILTEHGLAVFERTYSA